MKNMRLMISLVALVSIMKLHAGPVSSEIKNAKQTADSIIMVIEPLVDAIGGEKKAKYYSTYKPNLLKVTDTVQGAANIALNVEDFIAQDLDKIKTLAATLKRQIDCLKNPGGICAEVGCTSKNACIAALLKTTKELILLISNSLLAQGKKDDKGNMVYNNGALFNLASLKGLPPVVEQKVKPNIVEFANKLQQALAFIDTLAFVLNPIIEKPADMTDAEKAKLEESLKAQPIVIPADADFPSLD